MSRYIPTGLPAGRPRSPRPTLTATGYVRCWHGPNRGKYAHRVVMESLCSYSCYYPPDPRTRTNGALSSIPMGFAVEHIDHNRAHNCPSNLLLLDVRIHNHISWESWAVRERLKARLGEPDSIGASSDPDDPAQASVTKRAAAPTVAPGLDIPF